MSSLIWQTTRFEIDLVRPKVMAIVNLTPDSFSDGGRHASLNQALDTAQNLLAQGADILDIGGESSRPGAVPVSLEDELSRVLPFLKEAVRWQVPISVDTYKPEVMQAALDLGADIINDIWALRQPGALDVVARHPRCGVCLMHMHREPHTMQQEPMVGDAVVAVQAFLSAQLDRIKSRGIQSERIVLDPGIGFGKTLAQNYLGSINRQAWT
jgi:dihydropteroate synthase